MTVHCKWRWNNKPKNLTCFSKWATSISCCSFLFISISYTIQSQCAKLLSKRAIIRCNQTGHSSPSVKRPLPSADAAETAGFAARAPGGWSSPLLNGTPTTPSPWSARCSASPHPAAGKNELWPPLKLSLTYHEQGTDGVMRVICWHFHILLNLHARTEDCLIQCCDNISR